MNCPKCGKPVSSEHIYCPYCGSAINNPEKTFSLRCKSCGSTMKIQEGNKVLHCPSCGSEEIIIESDAVAIERIRSSTQLNMQKEKHEHEIQKKIYEDKKEKADLKYVGKVWLKIILYFALFMAIIYIIRNISTKNNLDSGKINPPISSKDCVGMDYNLIERQFKDAGFLSVEAQALNDYHDPSDLAKIDWTKYPNLSKQFNMESFSAEDYMAEYNKNADKIESIMIGNSTSFTTSSWFTPDSKVFIYYHSMDD